jgi:hypothetical protein
LSEEIVLLAVTRMLSGFCIAGIDDRGAWRRPVKRADTLLLGDISYRDKTVMAPFDRVALDFQQPRPDPPHVEDWLCDFLRRRPTRISHLTGPDRATFLEAHVESSAARLVEGKRSLLLMRADGTSARFQLDAYSGRFAAYLRVPGIEGELPCTDLRWRALGRNLVPPKGGSVALSAQQLEAQLGVEALYVALGLARELKGRHTPLAIGVHIQPDYEISVDFKHP